MRTHEFFYMLGAALFAVVALTGCEGQGGRGLGVQAGFYDCYGGTDGFKFALGGPDNPCPPGYRKVARGAGPVYGAPVGPGYGPPPYAAAVPPVYTTPVTPAALPQAHMTVGTPPHPDDPTGAKAREEMKRWTHRVLGDDPSIPVEITERVLPVKPGCARTQAVRKNGVWYTANRCLPPDFGPPD